LDCLAEDPSTASVAVTDDVVYRCAKCRLFSVQFLQQLYDFVPVNGHLDIAWKEVADEVLEVCM